MPAVPLRWDDPQAKAVLKSCHKQDHPQAKALLKSIVIRNDFVAYVSSTELALKYALRLVAMSYACPVKPEKCFTGEPSAIIGNALFA
jgi:hypothetical protein